MHTFINTLLYISAQFAATMLNTSQKMFKFTWHKNQCTRSINLTFLVAVQHRLKRASDSYVNWSETLSRWPWTSEPSLLFSPAFKNVWLFWGSVCSKNIEHIDQHFYSISEWCLYEKRIIQFSLLRFARSFRFWGTHTDRHIFFFLYLSNRKGKLIHGRI